MVQTKMVYELNHTYLVFPCPDQEEGSDYRIKVLENNRINGTVPGKNRTINGEKYVYFDITGKESLLDCYNSGKVSGEDLLKLFGSIYRISEELSRYLMEEDNVILSPEYVFKNLSTDTFEFICFPVAAKKMKEYKHENITNLLQFMMMHLDENDEKLLTAVYGIYDMVEKSNTGYKTIYESLISCLSKETEETEEAAALKEPETEEPFEMEEKAKNKFFDDVYIPSFIELGAVMMCLTGLAMVGYRIYLTFLV